MARGVPFIYHNPHGERVPTFEESSGAFQITRTVDELVAAIAEAEGWTMDYRERSRKFFSDQVDMDGERLAEQRAATVIESLLSEEHSLAGENEHPPTP